jgi:hypothetical protein
MKETQTYCYVLRMISVTNNTTRVRNVYRIYSLWRFTAATQLTITVSTIALVASRCDDSLRALTVEDWLTHWLSKTDSRTDSGDSIGED